jgi:rhodanese-related sulfurtransferase
MPWIWILLSIVSVAILADYLISWVSPQRISAEQAKEWIQDHKIDVILDVRTVYERNTLGYYPGSIHIPAGDIPAEVPSRFPNTNMTFLIYCNTGQRARRAAATLRGLGYENVYYIATGHTSIM